MAQTKTYIGILPELNRCRGMAVYQIVALCGTAEKPTETMKEHIWLFSRAFIKINDGVFPHSPLEVAFAGWSDKAIFRPTLHMHPTIIKTTSCLDYSIVSQRLRDQYAVWGDMNLIEGDLALPELRKTVAQLERIRGEDLFSRLADSYQIYNE